MNPVRIEQRIPLPEEILAQWKEVIGNEYEGYKNHVYRMIHFCLVLGDCNEDERKKIIIAGAFHDLGIWIEDTIDYIAPSVPPAREYLERAGLEAWSAEIELMITGHHKIRKYRNERYPLVELFRQGDLVDFSLGLVKFGIPGSCVRDVKAGFPNAGFHRNLGKRAPGWFMRHPLKPLPMMKW